MMDRSDVLPDDLEREGRNRKTDGPPKVLSDHWKSGGDLTTVAKYVRLEQLLDTLRFWTIQNLRASNVIELSCARNGTDWGSFERKQERDYLELDMLSLQGHSELAYFRMLKKRISTGRHTGEISDLKREDWKWNYCPI